MKIKAIHDLFKQLSDESQEGYYSPGEIDNFLDRASQWLFNQYRSIYGNGIDTHEALAPFVDVWAFTGENITDGVLSIPDVQMFEKLGVINIVTYDNDEGKNYAAVEIVNSDEKAFRLRSQLNPVTAGYPIGQVIGIGKWRIYPEMEDATGEVEYLRKPKKPFLKYTLNGRVFTYDEENSVDLEWGEGYITRVIFKAITLAGFTLNSKVLIEAGLMMETAKP